MIESLVTNSSFVSDIYMEYLSDMKCRLHYLHLDQFCIQQKHDKIADIYVSITVSLLQLIHILVGTGNSQH